MKLKSVACPTTVEKPRRSTLGSNGLSRQDCEDQAILDRIIRIEAGICSATARASGVESSELRIDVGQGYRRLLHDARARASSCCSAAAARRARKPTSERRRQWPKPGPGTRTDTPREAASAIRQSAYAAAQAKTRSFRFTERRAQDQSIRRGRSICGATIETRDLSAPRRRSPTAIPAISPTRLGAVRPRPGAHQAGTRRPGSSAQTLNKSLSLKGNPTLETLVTVLAALGLRLRGGRGRRPDRPVSSERARKVLLLAARSG